MDEEPLPRWAVGDEGVLVGLMQWGEDWQGRDLSWERSQPHGACLGSGLGPRWFPGRAVMIMQILVHFASPQLSPLPAPLRCFGASAGFGKTHRCSRLRKSFAGLQKALIVGEHPQEAVTLCCHKLTEQLGLAGSLLAAHEG